MSTYEYVETALWSDPTYHELRPLAKLLYIWSFTNPRCNIIGIYKVARDQMRVETGMSKVALEQSLAECQAAKLLFYDGLYAFVRARVKYLQGKSPNTAKGIGRELKQLDQLHPYVQGFIFLYQDFDWPALGTLLGDFDVPNINPLYAPTKGLREFS